MDFKNYSENEKRLRTFGCFEIMTDGIKLSCYDDWFLPRDIHKTQKKTETK